MKPNKLDNRNPYVGPVPFKLEDKNIFFGRKHEIQQLIYLLIAEQIVMLHSPSGAGKTSLIQAGLIPAVYDQKKRFQVLPIMHVGKIPDPSEFKELPAHNRYVLSAIMSMEEEKSGEKEIEIPLNQLADFEFEIYLEKRWKPDKFKPHQILIFDQFEEILTGNPTDQDAKAEFFRQVGQVLRHSRRWALFSMREDYLASLDPFILPIPGQLETRFRLDLLTKKAALEAIKEPASKVDVTFHDNAAESLRKELSRVHVQKMDGSSEWVDGPYAEPILLQVVCRHLWELKSPQAKKITLEEVSKLVSVDDALSDYYSKRIKTISTEKHFNEGDLRDWFDMQLITEQGVRTQLLREPERSGGLDNEAIEDLVQTHLVRPETRRGLTWYELAHDRLIEPIRKNNKEWRDESLKILIQNYDKFMLDTARLMNIPEWKIRDWINHELITKDGTRGYVEDTKIEPVEFKDAVDKLVDLELLHKVRVISRTLYGLAQERLIEPIRKSNANWREKNLSPFHSRAVRWVAEPNSVEILLTEGELIEMEHWVNKYPDRVTPQEVALLKASKKERTQERRQQQLAAELRTNIADLGWGVIFAIEDRDRIPMLKSALAELLQLRQEQAGYRYREFVGPDAYRSNETVERFLARFGVGPATINPDMMPYYLLIVGDPEMIPFDFQYRLDVQHAVGRIHFDRLEDYTRYARSVVMAEKGHVTLPPKVSFFGPSNPDDGPTQMSLKKLVKPLSEMLRETRPRWEIENVLTTEATKAELAQLLGGKRTPALLFTASHGMSFPINNQRQLSDQGALLCQDWPGPRNWRGSLPDDYYFTAEDVSDDARLLGLVAFLWGEYTIGTPKLEDFHTINTEPREIAPHAFLSRLPQRLLSHPQGGALAVIGHVERAWGYSFADLENPSIQLDHFEQTLQRLLDGHTVGSALEPFNQRYSSLASTLASSLQEIVLSNKPIDNSVWSRVIAMIDARNYVILGDPAVRLPVDLTSKKVKRPTIESVSESRESFGLWLKPEIEAEGQLPRSDRIIFNGIDATTGEYLLPSMSMEQIAMVVISELPHEQISNEIKRLFGDMDDIHF